MFYVSEENYICACIESLLLTNEKEQKHIHTLNFPVDSNLDKHVMITLHF